MLFAHVLVASPPFPFFLRESTMSNQDPKPSKAQPPAQRVETLEDAIYKPTLSENNAALRGTNPLIAIPTTILTYTAIALIIFFVATKTEAGKKALEKTIGVILDENEKPPEEDLPPPPPPPPPPAVVVPTRVEIKDAPTPPPVTDQEVVPDEAPKELPKVDYSLAYAGKSDSATTTMGQIGGVPGGAGTGAGVVGGTGTAVVHDFDYRDMVVTFQPPTPPYPKMAQAARIQGSVKLEMVIGTDGVPTTISIISGHPHLQSHAIEYAKKWRFKPALVDGHPVPARFQLNLNFKLPGS